MIYYNAKTNNFYISDLNEIPENSVEITKEKHAELLESQANGLVIQPDEKGYPVAEEYIMTDNEIKMSNETQFTFLLDEANAEITLLERSVKLKRATDKDTSRLAALENYTVDLYNLDLTNVSIEWPQKPVN